MIKLSSKLTNEEALAQMEKLAFLGRAGAWVAGKMGKAAVQQAPKAIPKIVNPQHGGLLRSNLARRRGNRRPADPNAKYPGGRGLRRTLSGRGDPPVETIKKSPWAQMVGFGGRTLGKAGLAVGIGGGAYGYTQYTGRNLSKANPADPSAARRTPYYNPSIQNFVDPRTGLPIPHTQAQAMGLY